MGIFGLRRHAIYVSDRELVVLERSVRAYAAVIAIQTNRNLPAESDETAHVAALVQAHLRCQCAVPEGVDP